MLVNKLRLGINTMPENLKKKPSEKQSNVNPFRRRPFLYGDVFGYGNLDGFFCFFCR